MAIVRGALDIREQRQDLVGEERRRLRVPLDDTHPVDDRPAAVAPLEAVHVAATDKVMWFAGSRSVPTKR